jgi:macrolide-specific efflux system membrane fusion protein
VKEGDLLAEIDPQVQAAKVDADEAQLAQLNANLVEQQAVVEFANATLDRYSQLIAGNSVSKLSVDESRRDVKTAAAKAEAIAAQIRQMQSTLKADRVALGYTRIFAPMAGTVVSIEAREGQTLNAAYSTPQIMRIADLATMTVWTQVSEADVTRLRDGMQIYFTTLGHGDRRWTGTLRQILPSPQKPDRPPGQSDQSASPSAATNNVVLYTALFDVDNASGDLRPEMTAQVSFITGFVKNAVIAPVVALRAAPGENTATVTVLDSEGRETVRTVKTGLRTRFEAEIVSGLTPGDRLVTGKKPDSKSSLISFHL